MKKYRKDPSIQIEASKKFKLWSYVRFVDGRREVTGAVILNTEKMKAPWGTTYEKGTLRCVSLSKDDNYSGDSPRIVIPDDWRLVKDAFSKTPQQKAIDKELKAAEKERLAKRVAREKEAKKVEKAKSVKKAKRDKAKKKVFVPLKSRRFNIDDVDSGSMTYLQLVKGNAEGLDKEDIESINKLKLGEYYSLGMGDSTITRVK